MATALSPSISKLSRPPSSSAARFAIWRPRPRLRTSTPDTAVVRASDHAHRTHSVLRRVREHVAQRLREAAAVELGDDRSTLPLDLGLVPRACGSGGQGGELDLLGCPPAALSASSGFQIREPGPEAVELRLDRGPVVAGGRIPPQRLADQRERGGGPSKLVLSAGHALPLAHSASVSL